MKRDIYLIGFSGSGKTSVGKILATKLKRKFYDSDTMVERKIKMTIPEIFETKGERWFRIEEKKVINEISNNKISKVVALGGGAFQNKDSRKHLFKSGIIIFMNCSQAELYRRIKNNQDRPLLNSYHGNVLKNKIRYLLSKRISNYKKADYTISSTNRNISDVVIEIMKIIKNANS
jgi:shikimate kinase